MFNLIVTWRVRAKGLNKTLQGRVLCECPKNVHIIEQIDRKVRNSKDPLEREALKKARRALLESRPYLRQFKDIDTRADRYLVKTEINAYAKCPYRMIRKAIIIEEEK